jgi:UDP-N-acetylmuramate: L-alanyl-gamma-D-glutamyl-meso-diaminopimelate ligase
VRWKLLGTHNQLNAIASAAAACHAGVEPAAVVDALSSFSGVRRRMEIRGTADGVTVYDDFAHHPTAVRTTLEGLRRKVGAQRVLAVLEPRSNTMKQGVLKDELVASVQAADRVFVFGAGLGWDATQVFAPLGSKARCFDELSRLAQAVADEALPGDHVLVMSNGSFGGVHDTILDLLRGRLAAEATG